MPFSTYPLVISPLRRLALLLLLAGLFAPPLRAQELARQPTAFTAWLDFHPTSSRHLALPIWLERLDTETLKSPAGIPLKTTFRLRFRHLGTLNREILLRVYFDDLPGQRPTVTGWSEIGTQRFPPMPLGQGLGLPSSETLDIPMAGIDYVDIEVPGTGANLQGALALSLQRTETRQPIDFPITPALLDPFGNGDPTITGSNDVVLFGRVKATLEPGIIQLGRPAGNGAAGFEFPLAHAPLMALLTFEVLNTDVSTPPQVTVNGLPAGAASLVVPDLADPAYRGNIEALHSDVVYRYAGWLKCQRVIPGSLLVDGTNQIIIASPDPAAPVALRAVEVQLKYTINAAPTP